PLRITRIALLRAPCRTLQQVRSDPQGQRNLLRGRHLRGWLLRVWLRIEPFHQIMRPRVEVIDPCLDRELPGADSVHRKSRSPQIVGQRLKVCFVPLLLSLMPIQHAACDVIVPISKDRRRYLHQVADHAFRGIFAAVYLWLHLLNDDAPASLRWFHAAASTQNSICRCSLTPPEPAPRPASNSIRSKNCPQVSRIKARRRARRGVGCEERKYAGHLPQVLSHVALAHAVFTSPGQWKPESSRPCSNVHDATSSLPE